MALLLAKRYGKALLVAEAVALGGAYMYFRELNSSAEARAEAPKWVLKVFNAASGGRLTEVDGAVGAMAEKAAVSVQDAQNFGTLDAGLGASAVAVDGGGGGGAAAAAGGGGGAAAAAAGAGAAAPPPAPARPRTR